MNFKIKIEDSLKILLKEMNEILEYGQQLFFIYLSEAKEKYIETVYRDVNKNGK